MVLSMTIDHFDTPHLRQLALWVLRLFSKELGLSFFFLNDNYADPDIAKFLGLPLRCDSKHLDEIPRMMAEMLDQLESAGGAALGEPAVSNLTRFSQTLGLNATEAAILSLFATREGEPVIDDSLQVLENLLAAKTGRLLSVVLNLQGAEVETALRKGSRLITSGVLQHSLGRGRRISRLTFFSSEVAANLMHAPYDPSRILTAMGVADSESPKLGLVDYPHLEPELPLLLDYLREVMNRSKCGVNILLHGEPGTGKTQLTRVVASELGLPVFDFVTQDKDGDPKSTLERLISVRVAGSFFQETPALFVFDEFEDILTPSGRDRGLANERKGWFNRMLETNVRPIFWLSNSIRHLDAAFSRRFDFIIEVPVPPRSQRAHILRKHAGQHLSGHVIHRLAEIEELAPAVVARVTEVFDVVSEKLTPDRRDQTFVRMVSTVLKAQGHSVPSFTTDEILPADVYDPACLNTGADLPEIARMLRRHPHARICLHGPPGTGKTAFGHWLAHEIDRPLHIKRASDLLNPFVGGTEMHIADTFEKALQDDAILMIDEVDSFLQDRAKAVRSWEVTQVNELLTRMESFNGVFIATTNRLEHLDAASLRRFDLKLRFDYLDPRQIRELLGAWCRSLGIASPKDEHRGMIESMECLTPGDFAAAARRHRFQPFANATELLHALNDECAMKTESARRIGFL